MTASPVALQYDPSAALPISTSDVVYRRAGQQEFLARVYQPEGPGPFPALVGVHGGAWAGKEWLQNENSHRRLAESGIVVAAIQFRTSQDSPHPAALEDISYAVRWLKAGASDFHADAATVGAAGWSSGGHQVLLLAMRPGGYAGIPLAGHEDVDDSLAYALLGWPVIDPLARFELMKDRGNTEIVARHFAYFGDAAGMIEASPPHIIERGEAVATPPVLILQGSADEALPRMMSERFVDLYSTAGGLIELGKYPNAPHGFMREPGPNTERGFAQAKEFIARQLLA